MAPAPYKSREEIARAAGRQVMALVERQLRPRDICTRAAFENAARVVAATGGSTNGALHLPAMAHECGIEFDLFDVAEIFKAISEQLSIAGFERIALQRCDLPLKIGNDLDHAVEFNMAIGPAGEVLRLWEDRIDEIRPKIAADLREGLAEFEREDGVFAPASTWILSAVNPG